MTKDLYFISDLYTRFGKVFLPVVFFFKFLMFHRMQASQEGFTITWRQISTVACSESLKAGTKKCLLSKPK